MLKNALIVVLVLCVAVYWLKEDPADKISDDPNDVTIEYKCTEIKTYDTVPPEVLDECVRRGYSKNNV
jgi:hypothetical protein